MVNLISFTIRSNGALNGYEAHQDALGQPIIAAHIVDDVVGEGQALSTPISCAVRCRATRGGGKILIEWLFLNIMIIYCSY